MGSRRKGTQRTDQTGMASNRKTGEEKEMNYSKGEWSFDPDGFNVPEVEDKSVGCIRGGPLELALAQIYSDGDIGDFTARENARLIVALVNAAMRINPDNPMAVAENLERLIDAARVAVPCALHDRLLIHALSALEAK